MIILYAGFCSGGRGMSCDLGHADSGILLPCLGRLTRDSIMNSGSDSRGVMIIFIAC